MMTTTMTDRTQMDFPMAITRVIDGERVTRVEWKDENSYGLLKDGRLCIQLPTGLHHWIVSDGDLMASDWVIVQKPS